MTRCFATTALGHMYIPRDTLNMQNAVSVSVDANGRQLQVERVLVFAVPSGCEMMLIAF